MSSFQSESFRDSGRSSWSGNIHHLLQDLFALLAHRFSFFLFINFKWQFCSFICQISRIQTSECSMRSCSHYREHTGLCVGFSPINIHRACMLHKFPSRNLRSWDGRHCPYLQGVQLEWMAVHTAAKTGVSCWAFLAS